MVCNCLYAKRCAQCPAGKASAFHGATATDVCAECGSGQISAAGATACTPCSVGRYASDDSNEIGGGLDYQVFEKMYMSSISIFSIKMTPLKSTLVFKGSRS